MNNINAAVVEAIQQLEKSINAIRNRPDNSPSAFWLEPPQPIPLLMANVDLSLAALKQSLAQPAQHNDDLAVDRFAEAMKLKLAKKRDQGRGGWDNESECEMSSLAEMLMQHIPKGDPIDIANFCMMIHQREQMATEHHPCYGGYAGRVIRTAFMAWAGELLYIREKNLS